MGKRTSYFGANTIINRHSIIDLDAVLDREGQNSLTKVACVPVPGEREADLERVSRLCPPPPETKVSYKLNGKTFTVMSAEQKRKPAKQKQKKRDRRNRRPKH